MSSNASNASLADLAHIRLGVQTWSSSDTKPTPGFVSLGYDDAAFRAAHGGECATVDMSATLNGHALETDGGADMDIPNECYTPSATLNTDFSGTQTIEIHDRSMTITAVFAADALTPHTPTLLSPAHWQLTAGEAVQVRWSAPDDFAQPAAGLGHVGFSTGKTENDNNFDIAATLGGDQITFTMPSPLPRTGDGVIWFDFGYGTGSATTCTGADSCTYSAERGYEHSVTLAP